MRVYVTGASGFVGGWLARELRSAGHEMIPSPGSGHIEITDLDAVTGDLRRARPDAVIHLAAISFAPEATADPTTAMQVNVAGTDILFRAVASLDRRPAVLVASSSEVYGSPDPARLPLAETAPLRPRTIYGLTKLAMEAAALWSAMRHELGLVLVRPFNHTGPGQRSVFAVPAFVERVASLADGTSTAVRVGNVDVRRDIGDVRDVVVAYRLLVERMHQGWPEAPLVFNVATGRSVAIREIIETLCQLAGVAPVIAVDPELVRHGEPPEIVGDASALGEAVGWTPRIPLSATLGDMLAETRSRRDPSMQASRTFD